MREEKAATASQILRKRRNCAEIKAGYVSLLLRVALLLLAGWLLFSQVFMITQASGSDMFPAVKDGDLLIGFRLQKTLVKNDVVVFSLGGEERVGRILGRADDVITLNDSGTLLVNGTTQSGEILYPTYAKEGMEYPFTVPKDCVFILGDYRTQAKDSRDFGCIPLEDVKAKVITILRRRTI